MFKKCPMFPDAVTNHTTGRQMDCPHRVCKFNVDDTCAILQAHALAIDNFNMLKAVQAKIGIA